MKRRISEMKYPEFAAAFCEAVEAAGVDDSQKALAKLLEVSEPMIWSYRNGEKIPRMAKAIEIAEKLGTSVEKLLTGKGASTQPGGTASPAIKVDGTTIAGSAHPHRGIYSLSLSPEHAAAAGPFGGPNTVLTFNPELPLSAGLWLLKLNGSPSPMLFSIKEFDKVISGYDLVQPQVEMRFSKEALEYAHRMVGLST